MCAVGEENSPLVTKCMDFCRALATQGEAFNFSLSIGSSFSFSLDTRSKEFKKTIRTKKPSPSTLRRNAKRRQDFLNMKQNPSAVSQTAEVATVPAAPLCDMCDFKAASENGHSIGCRPVNLRHFHSVFVRVGDSKNSLPDQRLDMWFFSASIESGALNVHIFETVKYRINTGNNNYN